MECSQPLGTHARMKPGRAHTVIGLEIYATHFLCLSCCCSGVFFTTCVRWNEMSHCLFALSVDSTMHGPNSEAKNITHHPQDYSNGVSNSSLVSVAGTTFNFWSLTLPQLLRLYPDRRTIFLTFSFPRRNKHMQSINIEISRDDDHQVGAMGLRNRT
ncbi:hypothetical protein Nepgr_006245 [Nepenthes gracilis]|uniref:Uncharacterized protein n=1 Tax=Nepenthes gracilis TaxID=150966 RepID=A0AAD3S4V0_NEPGR|nr:hypothetical protein Nepgr_006245 [Nepenthes gracilis]